MKYTDTRSIENVGRKGNSIWYQMKGSVDDHLVFWYERYMYRNLNRDILGDGHTPSNAMVQVPKIIIHNDMPAGVKWQY